MRAVSLIVLALAAQTARAQVEFPKVEPQGQAVQTSTAKKPSVAEPAAKKAASSTAEPFFQCGHTPNPADYVNWIEHNVRASRTQCGLTANAQEFVERWNAENPDAHVENPHDLAVRINELRRVRAGDVGLGGQIVLLDRVRSGKVLRTGHKRPLENDEMLGCDASGRCYVSFMCGNFTPGLHYQPSAKAVEIPRTVAQGRDTVVLTREVEVEHPVTVTTSSRSCMRPGGWCFNTIAAGVVLAAVDAIACHSDDRWCLVVNKNKMYVNTNTSASTDRLVRRSRGIPIGFRFAIP